MLRPLEIDPLTGNVSPASVNGHPLNLPSGALVNGSPIFTQALGDARYSQLGHTHSFASLTAKPTTIGGYGITDFNSLGDARWSALGHGHAFAEISGSIALAQIPNGLITLPKLADMANASLVYRKTAGSGAPEVNSLATLKTDLGLTGTNSGDQVVPANTTATASRFFSAYNSGTGAFTKGTIAFTDLTSTPTSIAGYGIIDFESLGDARWSLLAHTHTFASLTSKPTTIAGYGITDFNSLGDARWSLLAHTHAFADLTAKPTTLAGYGITDAVPIARTISTTAPLTGGGDLSANRTLAISAATTGAAGSMSAADKTKLDAITGTNTGDQTNISGNAGTATALATGRTLAITGDLAWTSPSFNGTGNVTAAGTIANNAVTYAKLQDASATARVLGRKSPSAGDYEECTLSDILDFIGSATRGDILYRGASTWVRLPADTDGKVLTTHGASANPTWETPAGGGSGGVIGTASFDATGASIASLAFDGIVADVTYNSTGRFDVTFVVSEEETKYGVTAISESGNAVICAVSNKDIAGFQLRSFLEDGSPADAKVFFQITRLSQ
jgi:hypothetical protein